MKRKIFLSLSLSTLLFGGSFADYLNSQNSSFANFQEREDKQFQKFQKELNQDFQQYQKILQKEFAKYQREIYKLWGDKVVSTPTKWVEYSKNKKKRKIVDFEKGEIRVEIISKSPKKVAEKNLMKEAIKTLMETPQEAKANDELTKRVEKEFSKVAKTPIVKSRETDKTPIVGGVLGLTSVGKIIHYVKSNKGKTEVRKSKIQGSKVYATTIKLPKYFPLKKAKQYSDLVNRYSKKFKVEKALVYAIIHSESSFNPLSKSYVPAYGLMQIVPRTAGIDAYYFVYKRKRLLSASYLYRPKNNIELGSAYLHILYYNYFKNVKNPESRLYCTIASYNTGAGNVARAFVGKVRKNRIRKAVDIINQMSPDEVYKYLVENLPYDETKRYLQKVAKRVKIYRKINL